MNHNGHNVTQSFIEHEAVTDDINALSKEILDTCFMVHTELGAGLLESIYEEAVYTFLLKKSMKVERQKPCEVFIKGEKLKSQMRFDLVVEDQIILELKSVEKLTNLHTAQIHTYLKLSKCPLGLLINFNVPSLKNGIKRIIMTDKKQNNFV